MSKAKYTISKIERVSGWQSNISEVEMTEREVFNYLHNLQSRVMPKDVEPMVRFYDDNDATMVIAFDAQDEIDVAHCAFKIN